MRENAIIKCSIKTREENKIYFLKQQGTNAMNKK